MTNYKLTSKLFREHCEQIALRQRLEKGEPSNIIKKKWLIAKMHTMSHDLNDCLQQLLNLTLKDE